jgi:hypothetical protein
MGILVAVMYQARKTDRLRAIAAIESQRLKILKTF